MSAKVNDSFVTVICPNLHCTKPNNVPISARGKAMRCPYCNTAFRVPEGAVPATPDNDGKKKN